MKRELSWRITLDVIIFLSVIFSFPYLAIPLGLIGVWFFPVYAELIIFAFIHDALYGMGESFGLSGYLYLIVAVVISVSVYFLKIVIRR